MIDSEMLADDARRTLIQDQCSLTYFMIGDSFSGLSLLHATIEDLIIREEKADVSRLAEYAAKLPADARSEFWADNHPYQWEHIIAPGFRTSFFLTLMASVEHHLSYIARDAGTVIRAVPEEAKARGSLLRANQRFFQRQCGFDGPSAADWQHLMQLQLVRNILAHRGTFIGSDERAEQVSRFAATQTGLTVSGGELEMTREFTSASLAACRDFSLALHRELGGLCRRTAQAEDDE